MWFSDNLVLAIIGGIFISTGHIPLMLLLLVFLKCSRVSGDKEVTSLMSKRKICECGSALKLSGRSAKITLYTRNGIVLNAAHHEKRCRSCGRGYFYSFHTHGRFLHYDDTCLEEVFLVTSRKTAFTVDLLYEWSLSILHHSSM